MRTLSIVVLSLTLGPCVAHGGRAFVYARFALVQAQCGQITFGPCAPAFAFKTGTVELNGQREPAPTCPKTGLPAEAKAGTVKMTGVTKDGTPFSGTLPAQAFLNTTFGVNASSTCVLAGIGTGPLLALEVGLVCRSGKCRGTILPIACLPADCADVAITTEFVSFKVLDDSGNPEAVIATPGAVIAPRR
jgi:hypothetical protein